MYIKGTCDYLHSVASLRSWVNDTLDLQGTYEGQRLANISYGVCRSCFFVVDVLSSRLIGDSIIQR